MNCYTNSEQTAVRGRVVFLGDSITQDGRYLSLLNTYLLMNQLEEEVDLYNLGLSGETASGLTEKFHPGPRPCVLTRLDRTLDEMRPDWLVVCYGMNDGIYHPFSEEYFRAYQAGIAEVVSVARKYGSRVIIMTPPPFNPGFSDSGKGTGDQDYGSAYPYPEYDSVLERYSKWLISEANLDVEKVIDLHGLLLANGGYELQDGIHPNFQGHLQIAHILLRELFGIYLLDYHEILEADAYRLFELVHAYMTKQNRQYKEVIGLSNPEKQAVLSETMESDRQLFQTELSSYRKETPGPISLKRDYYGFEQTTCYFEGYEAIIVKPADMKPGCRWVWRTEFFNAFASADREMLRQGYALVHLQIPHLFGGPLAVGIMERFHSFIVAQYSLYPKASLFGFSRGGLYAYRYATLYPERISSVYLDAPVVDIFSWPGGKGKGTGSAGDWRLCRLAYGLNRSDEEEIAGWSEQMHREIDAYVDAGVPMIIVYGDADPVVPYEENGYYFEQALCGSKAPLKIIRKPGVGHHPHSLEDPTEIVEFLLHHEG